MIGIIEYLPQLSPVQQGGDLFIGTSIQLVAGKNQVDIDKWKEYADHPLVKQRIEQGILRVTFDQPTVITPEIKKTVRVSTPVETELVAQEPTSETVDISAFVARPPEVTKTPTPPKK